jgi:hypothetical protein
MRVVNCAALFCVIWTYVAGPPAGVMVEAGHDSRAAFEGTREPCDDPMPRAQVAPIHVEVGICPIR